MLTKFFVYLRVGPALSVGLRYALLVGGVAFVALTLFASLFVPEDDELKYKHSPAWRRESQTLTGQRDDAPTVRVPIPKEMNTYYNSLMDNAAAAQLNDDLCDRLDVVHEVGSLCGTDSELDDYDGGGVGSGQQRRIV